MFQIEALLQSISTKSDGSFSIRFSTQEMGPEAGIELMGYRNTFGWLLFSESQIEASEVPREEAIDKSKSQSQRLRSVLYLLFEKLGIPKDQFNSWYRGEMEKIIEQYKDKL